MPVFVGGSESFHVENLAIGRFAAVEGDGIIGGTPFLGKPQLPECSEPKLKGKEKEHN